MTFKEQLLKNGCIFAVSILRDSTNSRAQWFRLLGFCLFIDLF